MKNANKFAIREILLNAFFIFAAVTVVGMVSNVLLLLLGYLTSMPITAALDAQGYSELESQAAWLTLAVVSMLTCMLCSFAIIRAIGANTAQYCVGQGLKRNLNLLVMLITVALGLAAHAACCIVLANMSMAYLVIASPVQYIARFLGRGKHTIFIADAFDFPEEIIGQAIAIYIVLLALACMTAYITGYLKRIRSVEKKEREDAASARWEARKAEREARQGVSNAPESAWKPEIKRETLARETEKRLHELNREKILRTILFLVLWSAADVLAWFLWSKYSGSDMLSPSAVFFTMLLVVPFWPLKKYEVFLGKTYYAQVAEIRQREEALSQAAWRRAGGLHKGITPPENQRGCWEVYLRPKGGASEKLVFSGKDHLDFQPGDYVLKLSAFKYPVNCNFDEAHDVYCPNCGRSNPLGRKRCADCHFPLARLK